MKLTLSCLFFLFLLSFAASAQTVYSVKGAVTDTVSNIKLKNASVSVLHSKDSTLVRYTRVSENGTFTIGNLPKGKLFLLVTYPGYADYVEPFKLDSTITIVDFGNIKLTLKATLLANVIIKAKAAAVKIKGDTTEFNASSFNIEPNSKVEDLLKQLPGIQVDKDGKITAQGQKVNKVLLDGEEFFGDDPTLVTKNIRADMVDKVQLFDKTSDQAAFTGIDDGKKTKTINIKLKNSKKEGYFGKLESDYGTDKYYNEQGMFNAFQDKSKFSVYGTLANTGKTGLGWDDANKYGASTNNVEVMDGGGGIIINNTDDGSGLDGQYNGQGLPVARTGGTHYDGKWNDDKESINANYKFGSLRIKGERYSDTQNNLSTGTIVTNSNETFDDYIFRQKLDGTYTVKLDTSSDLKISLDGTKKNTRTNSDFNAESMRGDDTELTNSLRHVTNNGHTDLFNANALYTKKFKKKGRTLSLNLNEAVNRIQSTGFLNSTINYFNDAGIKDSTQVINQYKTKLLKSSVFKSSLVYTEPITKKIALALSYGLGLNNSTSNTASYNQDASGQYTRLDSLYSTNYKFDQTSNQGGAFLNVLDGKSTFNFGTNIADVTFDQTNLYDNSAFKRSFLNWNPKLDWRYRVGQKSLHLSYNGNTIQPQISQIQPLLNNTDPLNVTVGNPNLKPSFKHTIGLEYNSYKVLSERYIYLFGDYSIITDPIVSNTTIDSAGKSTLQSVNLTTKKSTSYYLYGGIGQKTIAGINAGINLNTSGTTTYNYVNNVLSKNEMDTYSIGLNASKYVAKKFSFRLNGGPTYTFRQSSLQADINDNGWGFQGNAQTTVIVGKYEFNTDGMYQYTAKTESFNTDFHQFIWNASLSRKFTKSDGLKFTLSANDLLNQNKGFSRSSSGNIITQSGYTTIKRYFMASLTWDFSKMGGVPAKK